MTDADKQSNMNTSDDPPLIPGMPQPTLADRALTRAASLPWWIIILVTALVAIFYGMLTSAEYQNILRKLMDNPHIHTNELYDTTQIVGEPNTVVGTYSGDTQDSVQTVVHQLLSEVIDSPLVTQSGLLVSETEAAITITTTDGEVTVPKNQIQDMDPPDAEPGSEVTVNYIERLPAVAGTLIAQNDDTMTVRTKPAQDETFATSRIMGSPQMLPCNGIQNCEKGDYVSIWRRGEILTGTLTQSTGSSVSLQFEDGSKREVNRTDIDYYYVPTLTIAVHEESARTVIDPGEAVQIGYLEGTDIQSLLDESEALENVSVPLYYHEGNAQVTLVAYPDLESLMQAVSAGDVQAIVYLASGVDRLAVEDWVDAHENAGVTLPEDPRECSRHCPVTVKLEDEKITGRITHRNADEITLRTVEAIYVVIDRDHIIENRSMKPKTCALNNIRGCDAGIFLTFRVTIIAYFIALLIGLFLGLMRVSHNFIIYSVATLYVEVIRGIPLLVIIIYIGYVAGPRLEDATSFETSVLTRSIFGLSIGYGAFLAEVFRAGIQSISRGQMEAARSLGMSYPQAMRHVILPQAIRVILPPLGNDFISMLKDSALISVMALPDLLQVGRETQAKSYRALETFSTVALLYLVMTLFLSMLVRIVERRSRLPR